MTEICAVLAFSALSNNDKTGLIFFTDTVEKYIPSSKGRDHVLYMVRELLTFEAKAKQTNIVKALQFLNNITRHKSIVFVLSDFADAGYHEALRVAAKKHDVIGIQVFDKNDFVLPDIGLIQVQDAESGKSIWLDSSDISTKFYYEQQFVKIQNDAKQLFRTAGADLLQIATGEDYVKILQQFFIKRV